MTAKASTAAVDTLAKAGGDLQSLTVLRPFELE
jgi:hypothetical protein